MADEERHWYCEGCEHRIEIGDRAVAVTRFRVGKEAKTLDVFHQTCWDRLYPVVSLLDELGDAYGVEPTPQRPPHDPPPPAHI